MAAVNELRHLPVEERQQQRADVRTVNVCVSHDDDAVVAQLLDVEILSADSAAERSDHGLDLIAAQHLVEAGLFDVEDFSLDGQDGLVLPVASLLRGSSGGFTFDDVELAVGGITLLAIGELSRKAAAVERTLAPYQVPGLAGRLTGTSRIDSLADDALCNRGVLLEELSETIVDDRFDNAFDLGIPELGLRLPLELRSWNLDADDAGQTLADVIAADAGVLQVLRQVVLHGVGVDRSRQGRAETREVRATLVGVDVVGEREHQFRIGVVPLQRDLGVDAVLVTLHEDRLVVDNRLVLVQVLDERDDAAFVLELVVLPVTLIVNGDEDAAIQERQLTEPLRQRVEAVLRRLEDLRIRPERHLRAALLRGAGGHELGHRNPAFVALLIDVAVAPDFQIEALRKRVHDRDADAVEAT